MGAAGILKGPRSPAGATGGHVAVTLRRKPLGRWSWSVGLRRTGIREEGTACVDLQGRCVGGAVAALGHDRRATLGAQPRGTGSVAAGPEGSTHSCRGLCSGPVKPMCRGLLGGSQVLVLPPCAGRPSRGPS